MKVKNHGNSKYAPPRALTAAEQQLVADNLGLARVVVNRVARQRARRLATGEGCAAKVNQFADELMGAGVTGLIIAAQRYDPTRAKFSTFATQWVQQQVHLAVQDLEFTVATCRRNRFRSDRVMLFSEVHTGVSKQTGDDHEFHIFDSRPADELAEDAALRADLNDKMLAPLDERERQIIRGVIFMGLTFTKVGELLGVCKERIRQLYRRALMRLRADRPFMAALAVFNERQRAANRSDFRLVGERIA